MSATSNSGERPTSANYQHGINNFEDVPRNAEGEVSSLSEKEASSHFLNEEDSSKQEPVDGTGKENEDAKIQINGDFTHAEENDHHHDHRVLNSNDEKSSPASIQKLGPSDHNDSNFFASHEHVDNMSANYSEGTDAISSEQRPFSPNSPPTTTKGHGLKKWRRIRRDIVKDPTSNVDHTAGLKRGSSNISDVKKTNDSSVSSTIAIVTSPGPVDLLSNPASNSYISDLKNPNDDSVSSTNAFVNNPGQVNLFSNPAPSSSYTVALGTTFSAGADDSDDRSSKSSTAASAPKFKHEHQREKHRLKNVSGKHLNSSAQRSQFAKGHAQVDSSKKPRGESNKVEKENSLSSMESDSRSYGSVFRRGSSSVNSDQVQSGNYNEEDDNDQQASEVQSFKTHLTGHSKIGNISPDCSAELSCSANMGQSTDPHVSRDCEPLMNSIMLLQSAQEALEREVHLFKEIGKGVYSLYDDSSKATGVSTQTMFMGPEACVDHSYSSNKEPNRVQMLENQLEEAQVRIKEKDAEVLELKKMMKKIISESSFQAGETAPTPTEFQHNLWKAMEAELESVFKLKIEAEVLCVVMKGSSNDLGVVLDNQIKFLRDQNLDASRKLVAYDEKMDSILRDQAKLVKSSTDDEQLENMQRRIRKRSYYIVIQLLVLFFAIGAGPLLSWLSSSKSTTVVPT